MAMTFRPFFLTPRTRVGDLQVLSSSKHPNVQVFFDANIPTVNLDGYLPKSSVHGFERMAKNLAPVGLERIVVHVHWGAVERDVQQYNWKGYQELVWLAKTFNLKVKVVLGFHHHSSDGIDIPLPKWVFTEMKKNEMGFRNAAGARGWEYVSFGCDDMQMLKGRSPVEAYNDFMESFENTFSSSLGHTITHMVKGAHRREALLRSVAKRDPEARDLFLQWYSKILIGHGDKVLQKARLCFSKSSVNISGRLAPMYYGYCTVKDCELIAGYSDYTGIMEMLSKNKCGICVPSFDIKDNAWWVKKVIAAAGEFQVPIVGENSGNIFDQKSFKQMKTISNLCRAHIEEPFSFNIAVDERFQYSWDRFTMFYNFVESMTQS